MIKFLEISDHDPALAYSPMVRAIEKTFAYIVEQGSISLTPLKGFNRSFVTWAVAEFNWPNYSLDDLYPVNNVLNEMDFLPVMYIHNLLVELKIGRDYKGNFNLTTEGEALLGHPGKLFGIIAPFFLFNIRHGTLARDQKWIDGSFEVFFNLLAVESESGVTGAEVGNMIFGSPELVEDYETIMRQLYIEVLRPLCWIGFLEENQPKNSCAPTERVFTQTPLWNAAIHLSTDYAMRTARRH